VGLPRIPGKGTTKSMDRRDRVEPRKEYRRPEIAVHGAIAKVTRSVSMGATVFDSQGNPMNVLKTG
jgi:hypothetical protein